jgi:hypothetical protein
MGIVFVVLFVAGFMTFSTPDSNSNTAKWAKWWNDSGHRAGAVVGAYLMVLAVLAFVWFLWSLHRRVGGGGSVPAGMMATFGSTFAGLALVSALMRAAIPGGNVFGDMPIPAGADLARQLDNLGFAVLLVAGALSAGAFLAVASYLARASDALPGWLTIAGYVVAVLQLAAGLFFPFILFILWVLVASIVLLRRESRAPAGGTADTADTAQQPTFQTG